MEKTEWKPEFEDGKRNVAPRYRRDMIGYGANPPEAQCPRGAKLAVQIVLNYEEGGENCVLHGDAASEPFLSELVGAAPWPDQRHWNMETTYEYGARAGFWRLHRLKADLPVTIYGVANALARSPDQVAAMKSAGWEVASHGLKWVEHKDMPEDEERAQIAEAIRLHTEVVGDRPRGWCTGWCSDNTVRLVAEDGGFATPQGFSPGDQFLAYLRDSFDALYAEGQAGATKMLSIGLHCRLIGRPGRVMALKRYLDYARGFSDVWFATRLQIAAHWAAHHPPQDRPRNARAF